MAEGSDSLEFTPTWVVASVCFIIVLISVAAERFLHYLGKLLMRKDLDALYEALQKLKEELMLLGFISLLLTVTQNLISRICIPEEISYHMLPCKRTYESTSKHFTHYHEHFRQPKWTQRRLLLGATESNHCKKGRVPMLSIEALHHLHIFIFVLAVVHVIFCSTTMFLGGAKIREWKHWENSIRDAASNKVTVSTTPAHHHREFVTERARRSAVASWVMSFFKQFYSSVSKSDYLALRWGFIMKHCKTNQQFDFYKYMMRVLETDFKKIVGISWYLWLFVVIFLLLNVAGWHIYFWLSFLPLFLLLLVGAKLEHIITRMAQEFAEMQKDDAAVKPSDDFFWFKQPAIILYLIHFILFQNSFEIAFFFWILSTYGFNSCIMEEVGYIVTRLVIGVLIQVLCSYSTLPLYAIVTQMGSKFKAEIFDAHMKDFIHGWASGAKKRQKSIASSSMRSGSMNEKDNHASSSSIQMQKMAFEAFDGAHDAAENSVVLEGIIASVSEHSPCAHDASTQQQ